MKYLTATETRAIAATLKAFRITRDLMVIAAIGLLLVSEAAWYTGRAAVESGRIVRAWYDSENYDNFETAVIFAVEDARDGLEAVYALAADWVAGMRARSNEFWLRAKLFNINMQRRAVRLAIQIETVRASIAPRIVAVMDRAFGLE